MATKLHELNDYGQSAWLDNISRALLDSGKFKTMIDSGIRGVTSNPSIFDKAISKTADYDPAIARLTGEGKHAFDIYDELTIKDVQDAADLFREVYDITDGRDGYISLEVSPKLAHKTEETVVEARRLHQKVKRDNLMIKVPSTKEGIPAIAQLISEGININATLIFSVKQYIDVANAYIKGLKEFLSRKGDPKKIASVASVFVSRTDAAIDKLLDDMNKPELKSLKGRAAVANCKLIYQEYLKIFAGKEFDMLRSKGCNIQRVLWASTSTKDPAYSDIKYVTELIGKDTVNTLPDETCYAFLDHGIVKEEVTSDIEGAKRVIADLRKIGIDIDKVCEKLLHDGVLAFERSFDSLLASIENKKMQLIKK